MGQTTRFLQLRWRLAVKFASSLGRKGATEPMGRHPVASARSGYFKSLPIRSPGYVESPGSRCSLMRRVSSWMTRPSWSNFS